MRFLFNKNDVYNTRFFLYNYNGNDFRIVKIKNCRNSGFEEKKKEEKQLGIFDYNSEEVKRCSLSRTKRNIRELALCNNFEYFVTLTVNSEMCDRFSLDSTQEKLKKILKKIRRNNKNFRYIFITEKHKNGAFHFHGLCSGFDDLYVNENGYYCSLIFTQEFGFNSFSKIKDYTKCCNYITKYITKECIKNSHNQIYISSRGLKKATKEEFKNIDFIPTYTNEYVSMKDFTLDSLTKEELLYFTNLK